MAVLDKFLVQRLLKKKSDGLVWSDFISMMQGLGAGKRASILSSLRAGSTNAVGKQIVEIVQKALRASAEADAASALADGKLTAGEIESIFGSQT